MTVRGQTFAAAAHGARRMADALRQFGRSAEVASLRWVRNQHLPVDINGDGTLAWCTRCGEPWPCTEFVDADERLNEVDPPNA